MDHIIYTAMTGANAAAQRQAVLSNNLANATTHGFRAELSTFRAVPVRGDGATTRVMAVEATAGYLDRAGPAQQTGRSLDAMTADNSWFAVQGLDGTEAYTRSGSFEVSPEGTLVTHNGLPVFSDSSAPISVPQGAEVTIGSDGTISAKVGSAAPTSLGRLKTGHCDPRRGIETWRGQLISSRIGQPFAQRHQRTIRSGCTGRLQRQPD